LGANPVECVGGLDGAGADHEGAAILGAEDLDDDGGSGGDLAGPDDEGAVFDGTLEDPLHLVAGRQGRWPARGAGPSACRW
jgi:hypothetical protein